MAHSAQVLWRCSAAALAAAALLLSAPASNAQIIRTDTGSTGSIVTLVPQMLAKYATPHGLKLQITSDQTLTRSAVKLASGQIEMSVVPPPAYRMMQLGQGPYAKQAEQAKELAKNLRLLFGFVGGHFHTIVWADSGMKSYADFRGKRVFIGPPGGAANEQMTGVIRVGAGLEPDKDYHPVKLGWGAATQAFQDGQMDVLILPAAVGSAAVAQLALQREIRIISLSDEALKSQAWPDYLDRTGTFAGTIPPHTYTGQDNDDEQIATVAYGMQLLVNESMDEKTAYTLTKVFWDNIEEVRATSALLKSLDPNEPLIGTNVPLHPGAARYFKEKGVKIPEKVMPVAAK